MGARQALPIFFDAAVYFALFDAHLFFHGVFLVVLYGAEQLFGIAFLLFFLRLFLFLFLSLFLLLFALLLWVLLLLLLLLLALLLVLLLLLLVLLILLLLLSLRQHFVGVGEIVFGLLIFGVKFQCFLVVLHSLLKLLHSAVVGLLSYRGALLHLPLRGLPLLQPGLQMAVGKVVVHGTLLLICQLWSL